MLWSLRHAYPTIYLLEWKQTRFLAYVMAVDEFAQAGPLGDRLAATMRAQLWPSDMRTRIKWRRPGIHRSRATPAFANLTQLHCLGLVGMDVKCHKQGKRGGLVRQSLDCLVRSACKGISGEMARQGFTRRAFRLHLDLSLVPFDSFGKEQLVDGQFVSIIVYTCIFSK